jgi:mono/diheme cytochrome c family protein
VATRRINRRGEIARLTPTLLPPAPPFLPPRALRAVAALVVAVAVAGCEARGLPPESIDAVRTAVTPAEHHAGEALFDAHCAACHGPRALGTDVGPALVHIVYAPAHHADEAFQLAVAVGVRAHHWRFGDMPPVPGLGRDDVAAITAYVRWLQRTAGIE